MSIETLERPAAAGASAAPILSLQKLDKRFGATHALKSVDLDFRPGEIHAIVGENGAGKSTLIKTLTGVHQRTSGEILWEGRSVALATRPKRTRALHSPACALSAAARAKATGPFRVRLNGETRRGVSRTWPAA